MTESKPNCINCGENFLRFLILFFNGIFILLGIALIVLGAFFISYWNELFANLNGTLYSMPYFLIGFGIFLALISLIGLLGAAKSNKYLLILHCGIVSLLILAEIILVIVGAIYKPQLTQFVKTSLDDLMKNNKTSIHALESSFQCCGVNGVADYNGIIPKSCCPSKSNCTMKEVYKEGCLSKFESMTMKEMGIALALAMIIVFVESMCIFVSLQLYNKLQGFEKLD